MLNFLLFIYSFKITEFLISLVVLKQSKGLRVSSNFCLDKVLLPLKMANTGSAF